MVEVTPETANDVIAFQNRRIKELEQIVDEQRRVIQRRYEKFTPNYRRIMKKGCRILAPIVTKAIHQSPSGCLPLAEIRELVKRRTDYQKDTTINRIIEYLADIRHTNPPILQPLGTKRHLYALNVPAEGPRNPKTASDQASLDNPYTYGHPRD